MAKKINFLITKLLSFFILLFLLFVWVPGLQAICKDDSCKEINKKQLLGPIGSHSSQYSPWVMHKTGWDSNLVYYCKNTVENGIATDRVWRMENWEGGATKNWVNDQIVIQGDQNGDNALSCSPGVVIDKEGLWHMYYVTAAHGANMTLYLYHATASPPGVNWNVQGKVEFEGMTQPFPDYLETPSPMLIDDRIVLFFVGEGGKLFKAISEDGYNFSYPEELNAPDMVQAGRVTYSNGVYYYVYSVDPSRSHNPPTEIRLAVSDDGENFDYKQTLMKSGDRGWDEDRMWSPYLVVEDNKIRVYYAGNKGNYNWWGSNSSIGFRSFVSESSRFTFVVLPDTQLYTQENPHIFTSQTQWIRNYAQTRNFKFVLHEGDITNNCTIDQWERGKESMDLLKGEVPYVVVPGNHDYPQQSLDNRHTVLFNQYFPVSSFSDEETFGGVYEEGKTDNSYYLFSTGGIDWLVLGLEFGPRDEVLTWANEIIANYPGREIIVLTHSYLYSDDRLHGSDPSHKWNPHGYGNSGNVNDGYEMWNKFVKKHENIRFVLNGHILNDGTGKLVSQGDNGNKVYQMLANYQMGKYNGGDGYLRLLEFYPDQKKIKVKTYSPYLDKFLTAEDQQFTFENVEFLAGESLCTGCGTKTQGDADCNNKIDLIDFASWLNVFKTGGTEEEKAQVDFDCQESNSEHVIDLSDFRIWLDSLIASL